MRRNLTLDPQTARENDTRATVPRTAPGVASRRLRPRVGFRSRGARCRPTALLYARSMAGPRMKPLDLHRLIARLQTEARVVAVQHVPDWRDPDDADDGGDAPDGPCARSWMTFRHPHEDCCIGLVAWRIVDYAAAFGASPLPAVVAQAIEMRFDDGYWPDAAEVGEAGVTPAAPTAPNSSQNP